MNPQELWKERDVADFLDLDPSLVCAGTMRFTPNLDGSAGYLEWTEAHRRIKDHAVDVHHMTRWLDGPDADKVDAILRR